VFCASTLAFAEWSKEDYALDDARIGAFNDAWYLFMDGRAAGSPWKWRRLSQTPFLAIYY
jgi:hypothetical protein